MLIESRIRRVRYPLRPDGSGRDTVVGSNITLQNVMYRFAPNTKLTKGDRHAHVCEVTNPAHIEMLLNIPEGFCEYGKPPRAANTEPRIAPGQPEIRTELEDLDAIPDSVLEDADKPLAEPGD